MTEKLRIELTEAERENWWADVAVTFSIGNEGQVIVGAEWGEMDELWGDGCSIQIPARVWAEAIPWVAEQLARR